MFPPTPFGASFLIVAGHMKDSLSTANIVPDRVFERRPAAKIIGPLDQLFGSCRKSTRSRGRAYTRARRNGLLLWRSRRRVEADVSLNTRLSSLKSAIPKAVIQPVALAHFLVPPGMM